MSRISPPTFTVYFGRGNRLDESEFDDTTQDLRPVVYVPRLQPGELAKAHEPRSFGTNRRQHEASPGNHVIEASSWLVDHIPDQGLAGQRERGVAPLASANAAAIADNRTDDVDAHAVRDLGGANRLDAQSHSWLSSISQGLIGLWARWQRRRDISRSIAALSQLDDRLLRDIGIHHRLQISERFRSEP